MTARRQLGPHETWLEGDTLCIRYGGPIQVPEMASILKLIDEAADRVGALYLLVDSNDAPTPSAEVRRMMAQRGYERVAGMVRYQRGAAQSSWLTVLLQNAARLLGRSTTAAKVVETEAEARAWLDSLRRQRPAESR